MKLTKLVVRTGFLVLALSSCAFAGSRVAPFADGERVTFLGDSITHGGSYHINLQLFWDLRHPGSRIRLMNCGVSGGMAKGGVARWSWDVAPQQADRTFVMFGMNDVNRRRGDGNEGKVPAFGLAWWQGKRKLGEGVDRKRQEPDGHLKTPWQVPSFLK